MLSLGAETKNDNPGGGAYLADKATTLPMR
jgi:hypothetical protein